MTCPSRPRILLSEDREAWYDEAMKRCAEACEASKQRVLETARKKEGEHD